MNISSNEIFHFTEFEYLKLIIKSKSFLPRFSLEFTPLGNNFKYKATRLPVAMVCFCDIPHELSQHHRARYGNHGIALTEKWKLSKGLNPVFYVQENSFFANIFSHMLSLTENFEQVIDNPKYDLEFRMLFSKVGHDLTYLNYYIKQFENKKSTLNIDEVRSDVEKRRFYDEREWRYIPFEAENRNELFLSLEDYSNPKKLLEANEKLKKYKLTFEASDIEYIIVENEKQKIELKNIVETVFNQDVKILIQLPTANSKHKK